MVWKNDRNRGQKLLLHSHIFGGFWGLDVGFLGRFDCDLKLVSPTGSVWKLMWSRIWSLVVVLMDFGFLEKREKMELFGGVSCAVFCLLLSARALKLRFYLYGRIRSSGIVVCESEWGQNGVLFLRYFVLFWFSFFCFKKWWWVG